MESVKICHFKTFRAGNFALRTFCCFFVYYIHVKRFVFLKKFEQNMSLTQINLKGVSIDLKLNNSDLSGNTLEFKTLPTRPRSHRYALFHIFPMESVKICRFKIFWVRIFARGTLLLFRCFNIHVKMCVLYMLRYGAIGL